MGELTPDNRLETFLAEGSGASIEPYTRAERILSGEDLEPSNRLEYFMKEAASGGGGGNPNSVQKIEGTLANPFGSMTRDEIDVLGDSLEAKNASAILSVYLFGPDEPVDSVYQYGYSNTVIQFQYLFMDVSPEAVGGIYVVYLRAKNQPVVLTDAVVNEDGNLTSYVDNASQIPTTLTIIWHPLPDSVGV